MATCKRCGNNDGLFEPLANLILCPRCKDVFYTIINAAASEFIKSCKEL